VEELEVNHDTTISAIDFLCYAAGASLAVFAVAAFVRAVLAVFK
jgi:hypothetical protein